MWEEPLIVAFDCGRPPSPTGQVVAVHGDGSAAVILGDDGEMREVAAREVRVGTYDLPPGIEYGEWSRFHYQYRILSAAGLHTTQGHARWRALATSGLAPVRLWTVARTIDYRGRSGFMLSIGEQVIEWLDTPPVMRRWTDPLSKLQWESVDPARLLVAKSEVDKVRDGGDMSDLPDALERLTQPDEERVLDRP